MQIEDLHALMEELDQIKMWPYGKNQLYMVYIIKKESPNRLTQSKILRLDI